MKYMKRAGIYKASNLTFNPETMQAHSYDWWKFVDTIGGLIVYNDYYFSSTTCKHQHKVRDLLNELGIKIDRVVKAPRGLGDLSTAREYYLNEINMLTTLINKKGTRKTKNEERKQQIIEHKKTILTIDYLKREQAND